MAIFEGGIAGELRRRKAQRDTETFKDSFVAKMAQAGANEDALELIGKIKSDSPEKLMSAFDSIQKAIQNTDKGIEKNILDKSREAEATTLASESAKLDPAIIEGKLAVRAKEKKQDFDFGRDEAFAKIQEDILKKGVDLTVDEKSRLVSAKTGQNSIRIAEELLESEDFNRLVIQQGIKGGKLTSLGDTNLRKYNTAVGSAIFDYVFAKSGAQVSDKERQAFQNIFDLRLGDSKEVAKFKLNRLNSFFVSADEVFDPNKVAGLSVSELSGRLNEIKSQLKELGQGNSKDAEAIIKMMQNKALGVETELETKMPSRGEAPKGAKGWSKKKGEWVF
jgi:hypothetical protein